jgi:hypothetical protein
MSRRTITDEQRRVELNPNLRHRIVAPTESQRWWKSGSSQARLVHTTRWLAVHETHVTVHAECGQFTSSHGWQWIDEDSPLPRCQKCEEATA